MTTYKEKALAHVRSACPELMELSFGCWVKPIVDDAFQMTHVYPGYIFPETWEIIGHTPHLEHWLRGIKTASDGFEWAVTCDGRITHNENGDSVFIAINSRYDLTKDGENQSEEFYKAYCEITNQI